MSLRSILSVLFLAALFNTQGATAQALRVTVKNRQNFYQVFPKSFVCYFSSNERKALIGSIGNKVLKTGREWERVDPKAFRVSKRNEIRRLKNVIARTSLSQRQRLQLNQKLQAAISEIKLLKVAAAQCKLFNPANCQNNHLDSLEEGIDCGNVCQNACYDSANPTSTPTATPQSTPSPLPTATPTATPQSTPSPIPTATPTFNPFGGGTGKGFGKTVCDDGQDNDGDGLIDMLDPGCEDPSDEDESHDPLETCTDPGTDTAYLLNEAKITISADEQDFTVSLGDTVIRESTGDKLYVDKSAGKLSTNVRVVRQCAGVDIVYKITNNSSTDQLLPYFNIGGFRVGATGLKYLPPKEHGGLQTLELSTTEDTFKYGLLYPTDITYSPVMVLSDGAIAIGTSFRYPYLEYQNIIRPQLQVSLGVTPDGKRKSKIDYEPRGETMPAHSERIYSVTYRFSSARNYLLTLSPYKQYFQGLYHSTSGGSTRSTQIRDLSPVRRVEMAGFARDDEAAWADAFKDGNERGYDNHWRIDLFGWGELKTPDTGRTILDHAAYFMEKNGYRRIMLVKPSGVYDPRLKLAPNFPPAFMNWPASAESHGKDSLTAFTEFIEGLTGYQPKTLGFWWGRAGQVPVDKSGKVDAVSWPPHHLVAADYFDESHMAFMRGQLSLAVGYGATEIGLDAFKTMPMLSAVLWAKEMTSTYPDVRFIAELGNDILHSIMPIEIHDTGKAVQGPNVLSNYLNPGVEFRVAALDEHAKDMALWGYTYVGRYSFPPDYAPRVGRCFDGIDNDGDGKIDFPYDFGCSNEFDDSE